MMNRYKKRIVIVVLLLIVCVAGIFLVSIISKEGGTQITMEQESRQTADSKYGIENFVELRIPCDESSMIAYQDNEEAKQGKEWSNVLGEDLTAEIKKVSPNFEKEYYVLNAFYDDSSLYQILLTRSIPTEGGNVYLGIKYSVYVEDGVALELSYRNYPSHQTLKKEETIPERVQAFVESGGENVQLPDIPNALVEIDEDQVFYSYDAETDELTYTVGYEITHLDEEGALSTGEIVVQVPSNEERWTDKIFLIVSGSIVFVLMGFLYLGKFKINKEK